MQGIVFAPMQIASATIFSRHTWIAIDSITEFRNTRMSMEFW